MSDQDPPEEKVLANCAHQAHSRSASRPLPNPSSPVARTPVEGDRGALAEIGGETLRVLRVSLEPADGTPRECGEGTLWIVETEPA